MLPRSYINFNSTVVQLEDVYPFEELPPVVNFNSTVVQLEEHRKRDNGILIINCFRCKYIKIFFIDCVDVQSYKTPGGSTL